LIIISLFSLSICYHFSWSALPCFCISLLRRLASIYLSIVWYRVMTRWWKLMTSNFFFFLIFVVIFFRSFIPSCSSWHDSRLSSMAARSTIKIITSVFLLVSHFSSHLKVFIIRTWSCSDVILIKLFKLVFFSFLNMNWNSCFWLCFL